MPLAVGTKAPDFTLSIKTADGPKQIRLSENFGKKNTVLHIAGRDGARTACLLRLNKQNYS
jgi:peroxiredoxin